MSQTLGFTFIIIGLVCLLVLIVSVLAIWCQTAMLAIIVDDKSPVS